MNPKTLQPVCLLGLALGAALLPMLTGCVAGPGYTTAQANVVLDDDYVYYPDYEVYYSSNHHRYVYRDGRNWVTRPTPPRVKPDILLASPSVHVDFHDAPEHHHENVVKSYPKNWKPPAPNHEVRKDNHDNGPRDDKPGDQKRDHDDHDRKRD